MINDSDAMVPAGDGLWLSTTPIRFLGLRLTATMAVLRLRDGSLLVYSPVRLSAGRRAAIEGMGQVAHLYVPNLFHHSWIGDWAAAFPSARVHAPPGLAKKRPDLRIDRIVGEMPEPAFAGVVDEMRIEGCRLGEIALLYRPARTLVVADLVHNVGRPSHWWTATYARAMGFYDRVALSRVLRWTIFRDRRAARRSLDDILSRPFDGLIVGHGQPLARNAREAFSSAYAWLPSVSERT